MGPRVIVLVPSDDRHSDLSFYQRAEKKNRPETRHTTTAVQRAEREEEIHVTISIH